MHAKIFMIILLIGLGILNSIFIPNIAMAKNTKANEQMVELPKININTATIEDFQSISGVGPTLAARIAKYRADKGDFQKIEDIMQVKGVGEAKFSKIKERLTV